MMKIAWIGKHFGEEPPLVGGENQGAGGVFFSGCNLRCVFCQNSQISQDRLGRDYAIAELVDKMLELQAAGAVNVDLVTPTIWWKEVKEAIQLAKNQKLTIPILWNSNAYESESILRQMDGLVDIYLPDLKYGDDNAAAKYSHAVNYSSTAESAIREMLRQTGHLQIDEQGIAIRGVIVRHLILPNHVENSLQALKILRDIDPSLHVSLMRQYSPLYHADGCPEINRLVAQEEFDRVFDSLCQLDLTNGWVQEDGSHEIFIPDFTKERPFG